MSFQWKTEGQKTNPNTNVLLADTGALEAATHTVNIAVGTTIAGSVVFAWRNVANDADLRTQGFHIDPTTPLVMGPFSFDVPTDERFIIRTSQQMLGVVQASIFHD